jgi:very-short-patch-repair endonuclease
MLSFIDKQKTLFWRLKKLKSNPTKSELEFMDILDKNNIKYIFQKWFIKWNNYCIIDFYIPNKKICIEIDGWYHLNKEQKIRDYYRDKYLTEYRKFKVIRILNEDIYNFDTNKL